jgi:hypothetical protein
VAKHLPDVRLIMAMRNPVDRSISSYFSSQSEHRWKSFDDYVANRPDVLERGHYAEQVEALLSYFTRSQILLLFYDDLVADDRSYLRLILRFIGVEEEFACTQIGAIRNSTTFPRIRNALYRVGLRSAVRAMSRSYIGNFIRRTRRSWKPSKHSTSDPAIRQRLIEYFHPWNSRLSALTGRDLSAWDQ